MELGWLDAARCVGRHDLFDPLDDLDPADRTYCIGRAIAICSRCPVIAECEAHWHNLPTQLKEFGGTSGTLVSNEPLLAANNDVSGPTSRSVLGVPLWPLPSGVIEPGVLWAWDKSRVMIGMRRRVTLVSCARNSLTI